MPLRASELLDYRLLAVCRVPAREEIVEGAVFFADVFARVVAQALGD